MTVLPSLTHTEGHGWSGLESSRGARGEANYPKIRLQERRLMVRWWRLWSKKKEVEKEPMGSDSQKQLGYMLLLFSR